MLTFSFATIALAGIVSFWLSPSLPPPKVLGSVPITSDGRPKLPYLATDGSRLYFSEWDGNHYVLAQVSAAGGETVLIPTPFPNVLVADISPKRSELLVGTFTGTEAEWPYWILPVPGGSPRRLGDIVGQDVGWSPNGQQIVYSRGSELYLAKSDGSDSHKLATVSGNPRSPTWSPDGRRLRFSVYASSNASSLWEVASDGTDLHLWLPEWKHSPFDCCGRWTPDGRYYVFSSMQNGQGNIWAVREKESFFRKVSHEPVQLTAGPMAFEGPLPNQDGSKIFVLGTQPRGELLRYEAKSRRLVPFLSGLSAEGLDFSRDGVWVAYVTYPERTLWRSKVDGTERLQLSFPPMQAALPRWSPDGKRIVFVATLPGKPWNIHLASADGTSPQQLTADERNISNPDWSPDGNSLVFGRLPWEAGTSGTVAIHQLDLKTKHVSTLPGSEGLFFPRWSPDGRTIAALPADSQKLMLFDFSSRQWMELAGMSASWPNWSKDGEFIYFGNPFKNDPAEWRVRISDRKLERVVSLKEIRQPLSTFMGGWIGPWSGLAPDDSPLVLRDVGSQEIYALDWVAP